VELKLPRRQKSKEDRRIQSRMDQTAGLSPNHDAPGTENGVVAEELPAPTEPLEDLVETEEETCTSANWMSYFSYKQQNQRDGPYTESSSDQFDSDKPSKGKAFTLNKNYGAVIELSISSPYLRGHLLRVIDIEFYNGVNIGSSKTALAWPYTPLYHHLEEMRANIHNDHDATKSQRNDIDALHYFVTEGPPAKLYEDVRSKIAQGFIVYDEIWALFKPGDFAVLKDPVGNNDICGIESVKLEISPYGTIWGPQYFWYMTLIKIAWKGGRFRRVSTRWRMESFTGSRKISDLQICPLWILDDRDSLKDAAIQRGKLWKKLHEGEPTTMVYDGQALCLLTENSFRNDNYLHEREGVFESDYNTFDVRAYLLLMMICSLSKLSSIVVVDPNARSKAMLQAAIDVKRHLQHPAFGTENAIRSRIDSEFSDEEYTICPASITVFSLDIQEWCSVSVSNLKPKEWRPATFDRLVFDHEKKDTLTRLAKTNSRRVQSKKSADIIEGKGRGIVLLLHGPPGVGKTVCPCKSIRNSCLTFALVDRRSSLGIYQAAAA
jgi:hypothetical protein